MNRIKAFFYLDKHWFKEIYKVNYIGEDVLSHQEQDTLSNFMDKHSAQQFLIEKGINLYSNGRVSLKDFVRLLKEVPQNINSKGEIK